MTAQRGARDLRSSRRRSSRCSCRRSRSSRPAGSCSPSRLGSRTVRSRPPGLGSGSGSGRSRSPRCCFVRSSVGRRTGSVGARSCCSAASRDGRRVRRTPLRYVAAGLRPRPIGVRRRRGVLLRRGHRRRERPRAGGAARGGHQHRIAVRLPRARRRTGPRRGDPRRDRFQRGLARRGGDHRRRHAPGTVRSRNRPAVLAAAAAGERPPRGRLSSTRRACCRASSS